MDIRIAENRDIESINDIYNQAVTRKMFTADLKCTEINFRKKWFDEHEENNYPILVCDINNTVCGWASISSYRPGREALRYTAEISYYVDFSFQGKGIGTRLIERAIQECKNKNIKTLFAIILEWNEPSIKLLKKFEFVQWGYLPNVADFDGKECSHVYYGLRIAK